MSFKTRKISHRPRLHVGRHLKKIVLTLCRGLWGIVRGIRQSSPRERSLAVGVLMAVLAIFVVARAMLWTYDRVSTFNWKSMLFGWGAELQKDPNGYTNLLLMGTGGENHDGLDLIDTIMVASIDFQKKAVSLFSIPRDFYVNSEYQSRVNEIYRDNKNKRGDTGALERMTEAVGQVVDLSIQYYAKIDFKAFVEVVDSVGGVTVVVDQDLIDPYYPNATEDGYEPFEIRAGTHRLDGETALKFVRSRKTTSDFDRAARQQRVLMALREKALSKEILASPRAIKNILGSIRDNLTTNLSLREMISLAEVASQIQRDHVISKVIHDDPAREGGLLYTPPRDDYHGAFVLLPVGEGYETLNKYTRLVFQNRDLFLNPPKIEILNGTKEPGLAGQLEARLNRFGFNVVLLGNARREKTDPVVERTVMKAYRWTQGAEGGVAYQDQEALQALAQWVPGEVVQGDQAYQGQGVDISIILGTDYLVALGDQK